MKKKNIIFSNNPHFIKPAGIFVPKKNLLQDLISRGKAMSFFAILITVPSQV